MATLREMLQATLPQQQINVPDFLQTQAQQFDATQPNVANGFRTLLNERNDSISNVQRGLLDTFDSFNSIRENNPAFVRAISDSLQGGNRLLGQLAQQEQDARAFYAPNGSFQQGVDRFFGGSGQFLQNRAAANQANVLNDALRSGASLGAARASQSEQGRADFENYLNLQQQRVQQEQNAFNTLNNLLSQIQAQEAQTRQNFIINPYLQLSERQEGLNNSLLQSLASLEGQRMLLANAIGGTAGTTTAATPQATAVADNRVSITPEAIKQLGLQGVSSSDQLLPGLIIPTSNRGQYAQIGTGGINLIQ